MLCEDASYPPLLGKSVGKRGAPTASAHLRRSPASLAQRGLAALGGPRGGDSRAPPRVI